MVTINFQPVPGRRCASCILCCTLVPVKELKKPANTRCQHVFSKGCRIYATRPGSCRMWSCRWLTDPTTKHLRRPDKSGYVIDTVPDYPRVVRGDTGEEVGVREVIQIWVDPKRPNEWRKDHQLKMWIADSGKAAIFRNGNRSAIVLAPPSTTDGVQWVEKVVQLTRPTEDDWAIEKE